MLWVTVCIYFTHTRLVCSKDAMNGSAAGSVSHRCVQCSTHPDLRVVVGTSGFICTANKCTTDLLTVLTGQRSSSYSSGPLKIISKAQFKYFPYIPPITIHLPLLVVSMLYFAISFHQVFSAFPKHCKAAVSGPAFKGRTLLSVIHCASASPILPYSLQ